MAWSQLEQVGHAVVWRWLSRRCWLAESSTSGWTVPSQRAPVSLRAAAVPLLRKCYSSRVLHQDPGGGRASHGAFPAMNKHRYSLCPNPALRTAAQQGREVFLGVTLQHLLLKQHRVPDCVCGNHQTLTGAACSHRNTGPERAN